MLLIDHKKDIQTVEEKIKTQEKEVQKYLLQLQELNSFNVNKDSTVVHSNELEAELCKIEEINKRLEQEETSLKQALNLKTEKFDKIIKQIDNDFIVMVG